MEKTAKELAEYAEAQLGKPYWYGTFGQRASRELYEEKKRQYPKYYTWGYDGTTEKVHDCAGLVKGYLWCDGPDDARPNYCVEQDISANSMALACKVSGKLESIPDIPGVLVFMNGHLGVYLGNGEVVEARGQKYGVVKTKLHSRPWKSWGYCPYVTYPAESKQVNVALPVLKKGTKGEAVRAMQLLLIGNGFSCGSCGADASFGGATDKALRRFQAARDLAVDGSCGEETWAKLLGV